MSPGTTHITVVVLPVRLWVGLVVLRFDSVCPVRLCVRLRCVSAARMGVLHGVLTTGVGLGDQEVDSMGGSPDDLEVGSGYRPTGTPDTRNFAT